MLSSVRDFEAQSSIVDLSFSLALSPRFNACALHAGFSQQTNFPIVYEAAYATAQQIIRVARIAQQGQEEEEEEELMEDAPASEPLPSAASAAPAASASPSASVVTAAASASSSSPKRKQFDDGGEEKMEQGSVAKRSKPEAAENGAPATAAANGRRARS